MKGSQELIAHFNKREAELEEKATKLNMFLEGYAVGYNDTKAFMIDKACEWICEHWGIISEFEREFFRKAMEE